MSDLTLKYILLGEDKSATSTIGKVGGAFSRMGQLVGGEFGEILNKVGETFDGLEGKQMKFGAKLVAGGGLIAGIGTALSMMGSADKQASDQLAVAVENSGRAIGDYKEKIDEAIGNMHNFNFTSVETQNALQIMTQAMGDPQKALDNLGTAANLAAAQHISLADAASLVDKVMAGKGSKILAQYGIAMNSVKVSAGQLSGAQHGITVKTHTLTNAQEALKKIQAELTGKTKLTSAESNRLEKAQLKVKDATWSLADAQAHLAELQKAATENSKEGAKALEELAAKTNGQAAASVDNLASQFDIVKTKISDFVAVLGGQYGAALQAFGAGMAIVGTIIEMRIIPRLWATAAGAAAATAAFVANTVATTAMYVEYAAFTVISKVAAAGQWLLNAALTANPIGLVIAAIVGLIAIVVLAYQKNETFRRIVNTVWAGIKAAVSAVVDWFTGTAWPAIQRFVGLMVLGFQLVSTTVKDVWTNVTTWFGKIVSFAQGIPDKITSAVSGMWDGIKNGFRAAVNWIIDHWNALGFKTPDIIGTDFGGQTIKAPQIPRLALGGITNGPTLAVVGDNPGGREAIIPLSGPNARSLGGSVTINLSGGILVGSPQEVARQLSVLIRNGRSNGLAF